MQNKKIHLGIGKPKRPVSFAPRGNNLSRTAFGLARTGVALAFTGLTLGVATRAFRDAF